MQDEPWLNQPISLGKSRILAAGQVRDVAGIQPNAMRIMGSYGLVYMVEAEGYYEDENGLKSDLTTGDLVWIHPGLPHAYGPKRGRSWTQIYLILEGPQWAQWAEEGVLDPRQALTHAEPVDYWRRRFAEIIPPGAASDRATALRIMGATIQLVTDLLATDEEASRSQVDIWVAESQQLLGEQRWSPQDVARRVGLSYESFRKRFAEKVGVSPGQYQKRRRIERACAAIYQDNRSLKELADELGFCDVFHFSKTFRQVTGEAPSDFRRRVRGS
jgi:AraC-like DNA-binding protein